MGRSSREPAWWHHVARGRTTFLRLRPSLALVALVSCTLVYASEFLVTFDAEPDTRAQAVALEYAVFDDAGELADERRVELGADLAFPTPELPIRPLDGDWHRTFTLRARVLREDASGALEVFNERSFRSSFPPPGERGRQRHRLVFSDDCILFHLVCAEGETCVEGRCAPIPFVPPEGRDDEPLRTVIVATPSELADAVADARFGDAIVIEPGTYELSTNLVSNAAGAEGAPIVVRAREPGSVRLRFVGAGIAEVFLIRHAYWTIEGLDLEGACPTDEACEHAVHVTGPATHVVLRDNRMWDFNQALHAHQNREGLPADDGVFERNEVFLTRVRDVSNRVTGARIGGSSRWIVRDNVFRDLGHATTTSYAAHFAEGGADGVFERNLVVCRDEVEGGGPRVGLAAGIVGGGVQHTRAVFRSVVARGCEAAAISLHGCVDCTIEHATLTSGTVRVEASSSAVSFGNLVAGAASVAGDSTLDSRDDRFEADVAATLVDVTRDLRPRVADGIESTVETDFCGTRRGARPTVGALEPDASCDGMWAPLVRGAP